jgi:hypothetical protein
MNEMAESRIIQWRMSHPNTSKASQSKHPLKKGYCASSCLNPHDERISQTHPGMTGSGDNEISH